MSIQQDILEAAENIWEIARALAENRPSGTSLNSQKNVAMLARVINSCAQQFAAQHALVSESYKSQILSDKCKALTAELKVLKGNVKAPRSAMAAKVSKVVDQMTCSHPVIP